MRGSGKEGEGLEGGGVGGGIFAFFLLFLSWALRFFLWLAGPGIEMMKGETRDGRGRGRSRSHVMDRESLGGCDWE